MQWFVRRPIRVMPWLVASVLCLLMAGSPLAECPFMKSQTARAGMPCCPREPAPAKKHCPRSTDIQTCPLYATEGKLGIAKGKFHSPAVVSPALSAILTTAFLDTPATAVQRTVDHKGAYLVNRVLRI